MPARLPTQPVVDGGAAERQAQREAAMQQQERARLQSLADQERLRTEQRLTARADAERKDRAWARFYRKPAVCDDAATVECANAYIRARRSFEEKYARGEL